MHDYTGFFTRTTPHQSRSGWGSYKNLRVKFGDVRGL